MTENADIDPDRIDTLTKARDLSLEKWKKTQNDFITLFQGIDHRCGFCRYTTETTGGICGGCPVTEFCDDIMAQMADIHTKLNITIRDTLKFLKEFEVDD